MNKIKEIKLQVQVAKLLQDALREEAEVTYQDMMVKITISREHFEDRFGFFLRRIQDLIDEHHPDRQADIAILVRDSGSRFEHVFKIWKTAARLS